MDALKEAILLEAGFASFWGDAYASKVDPILMAAIGFEVELTRYIYATRAALMRAQESIEDARKRAQRQAERDRQRIADLAEAEAYVEPGSQDPEDPKGTEYD